MVFSVISGFIKRFRQIQGIDEGSDGAEPQPSLQGGKTVTATCSTTHALTPLLRIRNRCHNCDALLDLPHDALTMNHKSIFKYKSFPPEQRKEPPARQKHMAAFSALQSRKRIQVLLILTDVSADPEDWTTAQHSSEWLLVGTADELL